MNIFGDKSLLRDLSHKEVLKKNGKKRRRALIVLPGGSAGVTSAGILHALSDFGISASHFDVVVGISCGAFNGAAFTAGVAHRTRGVYEDVCTDLLAAPWFGGPWQALVRLEAHLRKEIDQDVIRHSTTHTYAALSGIYGELRAASDMVVPLLASGAVPWFTTGISIDGKVWFDGGCAHPCPLAEVAMHERVDDVLIIANREVPGEQHWGEAYLFPTLVHTFMFAHSWAMKRSTLGFDAKIARAISLLEKSRKRMRLCALFPRAENAILPFETRPSAVRKAGEYAYDFAMRTLVDHQSEQEI